MSPENSSSDPATTPYVATDASSAGPTHAAVAFTNGTVPPPVFALSGPPDSVTRESLVPPNPDQPETGVVHVAGLPPSDPEVIPALRRESQLLERDIRYTDHTRAQLEPMRRRLEEIHAHIERDSHEMVARLAEFGFTYEPETHEILRFTASQNAHDDIDEVPAPVAPPPPPVRPAPAVQERPQDGIQPWKVALTWVALAPLGGFLGYSIALMAGFDVKRFPAMAVFGAIFGIFILAILKVTCEGSTFYFAQQARRRGQPNLAWLGLIPVGIMILAELNLAGLAIQHYSRMTAFRSEQALSLWICLVIAMCFSTPVLYFSALMGWVKGDTLDTHEEDRQRLIEADYQRQLEEYRAEKEAHEQRLATAARERAENRAAYLADVNQFRENPRWQSALALYSSLKIRRAQAADLQKRIDSFKIERGMGRKHEVNA